MTYPLPTLLFRWNQSRVGVPKAAQKKGTLADALNGAEVSVQSGTSQTTVGKLKREEYSVDGSDAKKYKFMLIANSPWLPVSELCVGDGERKVAATCIAGGKVVKLELEPQEYSIEPAPGTRLRILGAADGDAAKQVACCTTVSEFAREAARATCVIDNSEATVQLELLPAEESADPKQRMGPAPWRLSARMMSDGAVVSVEVTPAPPPYEPGHRLGIVLQGLDSFCDATVEAWASDPLRPTRHRLKMEDGSTQTLDLNPANHCQQRFASMAEYEEVRRELCRHVCEATAQVQDAITNVNMRVADQALHISTGASEGVKLPNCNPSSVKDLAPALLPPVQQGRPQGALAPFCRGLVKAGPGAGKTWAAIQLAHELASIATDPEQSGVRPVPILCYVQRMALMLQGSPDDRVLNPTLILQYAVVMFPLQPKWWALVAQAIEMCALRLVLDGIDESAGRRAAFSRFARFGLFSMTIPFVITSRPEGVDASKFVRSFTVLTLEPLSPEETRLAVESLLKGSPQGREFSDHLLSVLELRQEHDKLFREVAFPTAQLQQRIEGVRAVNKFLLANAGEDAHRDPADGKAYDPEMRQKCADGTRVVGSRSGTLKSAYLQELHTAISPALPELDIALERVDPGSWTKQIVAEQVNAALVRAQAAASSHDLLLKLALLVMKAKAKDQSATATRLWGEITERTDEIYEVVEQLKPIFELFMRHLLTSLGLDPDAEVAKDTRALMLAGLKDPVPRTPRFRPPLCVRAWGRHIGCD